MYHPLGARPEEGLVDQDSFEFLELANTGVEPIDLKGYRFTIGIQLVFSELSLAPEERLVIVADLDAFQEPLRDGAADLVRGILLREVTTLDAHEGMTLLGMTRQLYPHDSLGDIYYAGVVEALDGEAKGNGELAGTIKEGVAELDGAMGVKWIELSDGNQLAVLKSMEDGGFFQKVRGTTVVALYNNPLVWRHFGYEGSSHEYGGYLERGFDDLRWAGEPSADASPKAG